MNREVSSFTCKYWFPFLLSVGADVVFSSTCMVTTWTNLLSIERAWRGKERLPHTKHCRWYSIRKSNSGELIFLCQQLYIQVLGYIVRCPHESGDILLESQNGPSSCTQLVDWLVDYAKLKTNTVHLKIPIITKKTKTSQKLLHI